MVRQIHLLGLLLEFGIAGYKDPRHKNDKLSAHELLQNTNLFDPKKLKAQSAMDNIELNTNLTRYEIYIGLLRRGWEKSSACAYATKLASNLRASGINFAKKKLISLIQMRN